MMTSSSSNSNDSVNVWRSELLGGLELIRASFSSLTFSKHFHDTFVIELIEAGMDHFVCGDRILRGRPGDIVVINPFDVHSGCSAGAASLRYRAIYPTQTLMRRTLLGNPDVDAAQLVFPREIIRDRKVARRLQEAHRIMEDDPTSHHGCSLLQGALYELAQRYGTWRREQGIGTQQRSPIYRAGQFLAQRFADSVPLEQLAAIAELSEFHFLRMFKQRFGLPPHQFQINLRVENARTKLRSGTAIATTAFQCGFSDQAHLTRCFRRHVGTTPSRYSKSNFVQSSN